MIRIPKQVIVMRKDLGMRKGKMVAQGSHASLGVVLHIQDHVEDYDTDVQDAFDEWIEGTFTKICVGVDSEEELMRVYKEAVKAKLPVKLITDAGHTEFHGQPTRTCLAIGPVYHDMVDPITGELQLL